MQVDELQLRFKINERALLDGLIKSASTVSDEFADELSKKFEAAINKVTKRGQTVMQLGGLFVDLFNEFSEAAGDVDKLSSAMDNLVSRFEFLSSIEKKSGVKGLLNELSVANMDKLLDYYDKMYEAEEKIQKIREKNNRELIKQNAQKKARSVDYLLKMGRGENEDSKDIRNYVKKFIDDTINENEKFKPTSADDVNKLLVASRQYADLVNAYKKLLQEAPKKGSEDAVTQQFEIISILTELKKYEQQNPVLTDFRKTIEKEFSDDFKNIKNEASTVEVQGLTLAINNMVTALVKPLQTQIAKIYEDAIKKATGIAVEKGENIMQTYEEAVKVFNLQEEKAPASKKRIGVAKSIPRQFGGTGSVGADNVEEEINEFAKYYKSLEDAKQHIAELLNDRSVKATIVDSNNFEKIKDLVGYIQGYISLGGQIEDLNLDKTTLRRFNLQGMSTNYANQISVIKNTIIDAFKQVATNKYGTAGNAEAVNAAVANEVINNPKAEATPVLTEPDKPINQDSPAPIKVKPILDPKEFADEVTEQLIGHNAQIGVSPKNDDQNLFVTEVTQSLNGWNASIEVQPQIDNPSKFADLVSEKIQFSPAQIPVEPLSEGEFDTEKFAQQVTNRLIGESARVDIDFHGNTDALNISNEVTSLSGLKDELDDITRKIGQKTSAFVNEKGEVEKSVNVEIRKLTELKDVINDVTKSVDAKTEAFSNETSIVSTATDEAKKKKPSQKKKQESQKNNHDEEYDEEYAKTLSSAMADAEENLKREENERRIINELRAEGIKQEQEFAKKQKENKDELKKYGEQLSKLLKEKDKYPTIFGDGLSNISNVIDDMNNLNIITDDDIDQLKGLFDGLSDIEKLASGANVSNYIVKLEKVLDKNTKMSPETRAKYESYISELKQNAQLTKSEFRGIVEQSNKLEASMINAGEAGKSLLSAIKDKAFYRTAQYIATFFSFQDIIRYARQAISTVRELDTALVDLRKTTTMSNMELNKFYINSNDVAKQMGVTTKEIISQAAAWSRLGYSTAEQAEKMSQLSSQFASISPDMNVDVATDGLVSSMKAFDIEVNNVERDVMDNINRIGKILPKHTAMYGYIFIY